MVTVASQPPGVFTSGLSTDSPFQPLHDCGMSNPFFYHEFEDDFSPYTAANYTVTTTGTGAAVAGTPGDGGLVLFTAGSTAGVASLQLANACFTVNSQPKKVFFETRLQLQTPGTAGLTVVAGLIQTTTTPGTVADGVWFGISAAGAITINSTVGSSTTAVAIPSSAYTLATATFIDLAFEITRQGDVLAYVDSQLVGYVPQSNIGTTNGPQNAGAVARISAPTLTAVVLNPTLALVQSSTTVKTMTADFFMASKER